MEKSNIDCHVQLNEAWMKNFRNELKNDGYQVYCYNISNQIITDNTNNIKPNSIGSIKTRKLGAINKYYIKDYENYLGANWEKRFGSISKTIIYKIKRGMNLDEVSKDDIEFIKKFMALSVGRSLFYKQQVLKTDESPFKYIGINEICSASIIQSNQKLFNCLDFQVLNNKSNVGFVLPSCSYYYAPYMDNDFCGIVPLSDRVAICFKNNGCELYSKKVHEICDDAIIRQFNFIAANVEWKTNNQFLIAKNIKDLEYLKNGL